MKIKKIKVYTFDELDKDGKERALSDFNQVHDDPFMQSHMINVLKEELDERGIKYDEDSIDVRYSLSYCQGDGFMFEGKLEDGEGNKITIKHNGSPHYYHSQTAEIEHSVGWKYEAFKKKYEEICKKMERLGYDEIEYQMSEEYFSEACEANEWTFRSSGIIENI